MPDSIDRNECWKNLREALIEAKRAASEEARDAHLQEMGRWADKLAEATSANTPSPPSSSDYVEAAMDDTYLIEWVIPL